MLFGKTLIQYTFFYKRLNIGPVISNSFRILSTQSISGVYQIYVGLDHFIIFDHIFFKKGVCVCKRSTNGYLEACWPLHISLHSFFYKNIQNFPEPQLFHCLFLNFHCSLAILSLNILIKFILIKKKECISFLSFYG